MSKYYKVGDKVSKIQGYKFDGIVVSTFQTLAGKSRVVVDNEDGLLHIFNEEQLAKKVEQHD